MRIRIRIQQLKLMRIRIWIRIRNPGGQTFQLKASVLDPDPHGSVLILACWITIRIGNADPDLGGQK
jgi:hypothetical protein